MHAAQNGSAECAALLLGHKADVNARDKAGDTALLLAARYCREPSVVAALLRGGADASAKDAGGRTAFDIALARRSPAAIALRRHTAGRTTAAAGPALPAEARAAAERGLTLIERSTKTFSERAPCASCHHQGLGLMATGVAQGSGLRIDSALAAAQTKLILDGDKAVGGSLAQVIDHPEMYKHVPGVDMGRTRPDADERLRGLLEHGEKGGEVESQMAVVLASQQNPDGSWGFLLRREPMQSSRFTTTALAVRVLLALMPADRSEETARRVASAREWLKAAKTTTGEDRAFRLLGLKWAGAGAEEIAKAAAELKVAQRPDGGWAQLPAPVKPAPGAGDGVFTRSDAYATGQALYALSAGGGVPTTSEGFRRGVRFLLDTQDDDGSWLVTKRAAPVNTYFDAAFPHGQSQYSSYNATCWATMALSLVAAGPARPAAAPVAVGAAKVSRR
jgi:N-acyl-D-amino-acid deacylase